MDAANENGSAATPPRWSVPFDHDRGDPFVDLRDAEAFNLGRDLRRGLEHWRGYAGCTPGRHQRRACHHHTHGELLARYRGQGRGRRGRDVNRVELAWKRSESAEHHSRFGQWLVMHTDRKSRYVGKPDSAGAIEPYTLEEIAEDMARPGEAGFPLDVLEDTINTFAAARLIYRWQGREREEVEPGVVRWRGKVAILRVTNEFLIRSGMAALRQQRLEQDDRRQLRAERRQQRDAELRGLVTDLAHQHAAEKHGAKFRREVIAQHPDWLRDGKHFAIEAEVDRRLEEFLAHQRAARGGPPGTR